MESPGPYSEGKPMGSAATPVPGTGILGGARHQYLSATVLYERSDVVLSRSLDGKENVVGHILIVQTVRDRGE